jgi:uncharacterized membrane protein YbhN (UPF0104 family)
MTNSADRLSPSTEMEIAEEAIPTRYNPIRFWAVRLGKWMITVLVIAAVALAARESVSKWQQQSTATRITLADIRWDWLAFSAVTYAISLIPAGLVLRRALAALHQPIGLPLVMAAQLVGHLGKYVPGKAMVIILRASILSRGATKVSIKLSAIAVVIETLNLIAVGAALAFLLVIVLDTPPWIKWGSALMAVAAAVGTLPAVMRFALSRRLRIRTRRTPENETVPPIPLNWTKNDLAAAWFWCTVSWIFTGISMTAVVLALVPSAAGQSIVSLTLICSAAAMLAFVAGFLSLLPGGVGVRETVLATLLGPIIGPGPALLSAVVARLVQLAVESILAAGIWTMMNRRRIRPTDQLVS